MIIMLVSAKLHLQVSNKLACLHAVPRSVREALVSWDRQLFSDSDFLPKRDGPGLTYTKTFDLGEALLGLLGPPIGALIRISGHHKATVTLGNIVVKAVRSDLKMTFGG